MIGTVLTPGSTVGGQSTGVAARWGDAMDAADTHLGEPNVKVVRDGTAPQPAIFDYPRRPVAGLRAIVTHLVRTGIPRLPLGPRQIAVRGQGYTRSGQVPKRVQQTQQYVPVTAADQAGDWYQFLQ